MNTPRWMVRSPKLGDIAPLLTIATAVSQPTQPIQAIQQQANGRFWTLTQQNQPIGYATLLPLPGLPHLFELTGGIALRVQRQGAGSFLWRQLKQDVMGTAISASSMQAVHQITCTVNSLSSPAAHFLRYHQFELEHEEWTMQLENLPAAKIVPLKTDGNLSQLDRETAVLNLPKLYNRCFAHTPWFQPYSTAEITNTWEQTDELWLLTLGSQPIGFAWLRFPTPHTTVIEPIGIVCQMQGMGYGRILLTNLLQKLQNRGIQTVSLGVWANNETAVHLYQSAGFHHVNSLFSLTHTLRHAK